MKDQKKAPNTLFGYARNEIDHHPESMKLIRAEGILTRNYHESAYIFKDFFALVFHYVELHSVPHILHIHNLTAWLGSYKLIMSGTLFISQLQKTIDSIINDSLGIFFTVISIYKKGFKHDTSDDKPIRLNLICCRVIGCFICDSIHVPIVQNHFLNDMQHDFLPKRYQ